ncbi:hypothetical protein EGM97_02170 [Pseudomonas sp. AF32]|nr:hypothetical protein [Pseudomonas sp. AF32]
MWERACSRRGWHFQQICKLIHRHREQALLLPPPSGNHSAIFIKLSRNCGSALERISSDSRSTGVLRFGVSSCVCSFSWPS